MYLTQALHRAVQQHPDRVAVRFGTRQRTFREFADRVARLAGALQKLGMQPGDRVAMLALNSDRYLEYQMAASVFAVNKGFLDDLDVKKVLPFEHGLHQHLKSSNAALLAKMEKDKAMDKAAEEELTGAIAAFKKSFA